MNSYETDVFKQIVKGLCKINNISTRKPSFEIVNDVVVISLKNHLKDGIDLDCFHILNVIYQVITPLGIKFNQQLYLFPNSKRVASVAITFTREAYDDLNRKLVGSDSSN